MAHNFKKIFEEEKKKIKKTFKKWKPYLIGKSIPHKNKKVYNRKRCKKYEEYLL